MAKKLVPKRKVSKPMDENSTNIYGAFDTRVINTYEIIDQGFYWSDFMNGIFKYRLSIPDGTDKFGPMV